MVDSAVPAFSARGGRWINAAGFVEFEHVLLLPPCVSVASAQTHGALVFVPIWSCLERRVCDGTRSRSSSADRGRGGGCCHCCYPAHSPGSRGAAREIRVHAGVLFLHVWSGHASPPVTAAARVHEPAKDLHIFTVGIRVRSLIRPARAASFAVTMVRALRLITDSISLERIFQTVPHMPLPQKKHAGEGMM
jgi:hypothetical protein